MSVHILFSGAITNENTYHGWPTIICTAGNELLAVCSGGRQNHVCPYGRVYLYRSMDGALTWTGPEKLSSGPLDDRDAGICQTGSGALLVNYFTSILHLAMAANAPSDYPAEWLERAKQLSIQEVWQAQEFWMRRSVDDGKNWSEKYLIPANNPHGPALLQDGSLLMVGHPYVAPPECSIGGTPEGKDIVAIRSMDDGLTWETLSTIPAEPGSQIQQYHEPYSIQAANGTIITMIRDHNYGGDTRQTVSVDGGHTWSIPRKVSNGYPAHMLNLPDGRILMVCGFRTPPYGIRAVISKDFGETWSEELHIYDEGKNWDLGYPSTAQMPDGSFITLWYENNGEICQLKYRVWKLK